MRMMQLTIFRKRGKSKENIKISIFYLFYYYLILHKDAIFVNLIISI